MFPTQLADGARVGVARPRFKRVCVSGTFDVDATGLVPPFLLKVPHPVSGSLYSVGTEAGVINIHPFTDLVIQSWYRVQGKTVEAAIADPTTNPPPRKTEIAVIKRVVVDILAKWLGESGVESASFDPITTPFEANGTGFSGILARSVVNGASGSVTIKDDVASPTVTQTTAVKVDTGTGTLSAQTTVMSPAGNTSSETSTIVPTKSALQQAIDGAMAAMAKTFEVAGMRGAALADSDLLPFLATDFLDDGLDRTAYAGSLAMWTRGSPAGGGIRLGRVIAFDEAKNTILFEVVFLDADGKAGWTMIWGSRLVGEQWLAWGNQRLAQVSVRSSTIRDANGVRRAVEAGGKSLAGKIASLTASGGGIFSNTLVTKNSGMRIERIEAKPGIFTDRATEDFHEEVAVQTFPPANTAFAVTITPVSGTPQVVNVTSNAWTTEAVSILSPVPGTLSAARLGEQQTVTWKLPATFTVVWINLEPRVESGVDSCEGTAPFNIPLTATQAMVTLPATCRGQAVTQAQIGLVFHGRNGERTSHDIEWKN